MAQARNTPRTGKNTRPIATDLAGQRGDPYRWAGRVGVEGALGSGPVQLTKMRGRGWTAARVLTERGKSAPGGDLRPEYPK
jgi:hypothetical protein